MSTAVPTPLPLALGGLGRVRLGTRDVLAMTWRNLLTIRRVLGTGMELLDAEPGVLAYRRGEHAVAINTTAEERPVPVAGDLVLEAGPGALRDRTLAAHSGAISMGLPA